MTEPMTIERFAELADAYGGAIARWPASDRAAAHHLTATPAATAILARATMLDATLDGWRVPVPSADLRAAVAAAIPTPRRTARARLWWSGIGIAAALAGATTGTAAVALLAPMDRAAEVTTSFGDIPVQEG